MSLFSKSPKDAPPSKPEPPATKPATSVSRGSVQRAPGDGAPPAPRPTAPTSPGVGPRADGHGPRAPGGAEGGPLPARARPAMPPIAIPPGSSNTPPSTPSTAAAAPAKPASPEPPPRPGRADPMPPGSVRPTAPSLSDAEGSQVSIAGTFERLLSLDDLDEGFATLQKAGSANSPAAGLSDLAEVRALFAQLAVNHVRQVRDFMIELRWRDATIDWVGICEPALRSLRRAADKLELAPLCAALDRFAETLALAQTGTGRTIEGERRDELLARYDELCVIMPQAFALDLDRTQREAVILQSLLLQVPDVKKVTIDKLYAAGLTTLEAMSLANAGDLAATTGIAQDLAARIVERFRSYRDNVKSTAPDATRTRERERIAELTARLRREHDDYERAAQMWTREADDKKRELRKARAQTLLDLQVVLARLGEVERLKEIERLPFERKVTHLESFLEEARDKYQAQS